MKSISHLLINKRDQVLTRTIAIFPQWITPNMLTIFRILLIPLVVWFFFQESFVLMLCTFLVAFSLDVLDGSLARFRKIITPLGRVLDPIADKLLFIITFWLLAFGIIPDLLFVLLISTDLAVGGMLIWKPIVDHYKLTLIVTANIFGKLKTLTEVLALFLLFGAYIFPLPILLPELFFILALIFALLNICKQLQDFTTQNLQTKTPLQ